MIGLLNLCRKWKASRFGHGFSLRYGQTNFHTVYNMQTWPLRVPVYFYRHRQITGKQFSPPVNVIRN